MHDSKRIACLLTWLFLAPAAVYAQASITGVVKDTSGAVLPGASVEAASPELIEKARHAQTDSSGQYRIVDLRPGVYTVTFVLAGFNSVRHEGVELTGSLMATVNANLRAGSTQESVTVVGGNPLVDVHNVSRQVTVSNDELNAIPITKSYGGLMVLIPAIVAASADSQVTPRMLGFGASGGRGGEGRLAVDGLDTGFVGGSGVSPYVADLQNSVEVSFTTSGGLGEAEVSGPALNVVPRTGGNMLKGSFYATSVSGAMVGSNYSETLKDAGLRTPDSLLKLWDFNAGVGGPFRKDRLWFFASARHQGSYRSVPGMYANLNAGDPTKWTYAPDVTRPAQTAGSWRIANARLTAQVTPRDRINLFWDEQLACAGAPWAVGVDGCRKQAAEGRIIAGGSQSNGIGPTTTATSAPETASYTGGGTPQRVQQVTWQSPRTDRLLLEAGFGTYLTRLGGQEIPGNPTRDLIRVTEQCSAGCFNNGDIAGLVYRSNNWASNWTGRHNWRASASYVTGAQNLKVGYQGGFFVNDVKNFTNNQNLAYRFDNGLPSQLTELLLPFQIATRARYDAVYAQDQWTYRRLTLQGALRFDRAWSWFPAAQIGPTRFLPAPLVFPEARGVDSYKDISPRIGVAYDVFGNAKTSIKVNLGRYLEVASTGSNYGGPRPTGRVATSVNRAWTDGNKNFIPDCDLLNPLRQDFRASGGDLCAQISDLSFGKPVFRDTYDPTLLTGWGVRPSDWSFGASVQHEVFPRLSVEAGYVRRWLNGFTVTDNRAQSSDDFGTFSITAPIDPRLPGGGGYTISGLYSANQNVSSTLDNYITSSSGYGKRYQHYNGLLINASMRPRNGFTFQGGVNTGKTVADSCAIRTQLPETAPTNPYCHVDSGFVTRLTGLGAYTIPKVDVQIAGTVRSDPGVALVANYVVDTAVVAQSLGRPLSNNAPNVTVNLIAPGSVYGDRVNEISVRFAKILKFGRTRTNVGLDVNNIFNSAAVLNYNESFVPGGVGSRFTPTAVLQPRYLKISAQVDF
jgi:Carboxypeptidase regulatory-like domain